MKNFFSWIALAVIVISVQGCFPAFNQVIVDPSQYDRDDRLIGIWDADPNFFSQMKKGDYGALMILPCHKGFCLTLYTLEEGKGEAIHLFAYASQIQGKGYMNFQFYEDDPETSGYHLAYYEVLSNGRLVIRLADAGALENFVSDGKLAGEVVNESDAFWSGKKVKISATSQEVMEVISEYDLFETKPFGIFQPRSSNFIQKVKSAL